MIKKITALFPQEDRNKVYLLLVLLCIAAIFEMVGVGLIMPFIAIIQSPDLVQENRWLKLLYENFKASSYNNFIILCSLAILIFYTLKNLAEGWIIYWQSKFLAKAESRLATRLLEQYLAMPYEQYISRNTAELVNNITMEVSMVFAGLIKPFFIVVSDSLIVLAILLLLIYIAPGATLAAMATIGICSLTFYILLRKKLKNLGQMRKHHREKMVQWVNQSLGSLKEIIVLNRRGFFIKNFWQHAYQMIGQQTFYETVTQLPRLVIESFGVIVLVVITVILIQQPGDFLATIALFAMAAFRLMPAINRITSSATKVRYYNHALDALSVDLQISRNLAILDESDAQKNTADLSFKKEIQVQNISFTYLNTTAQILRDISLNIKKGDSIGIIGASGSGKSTFVDILLGLLQPQQGRVLIDGIDMQQNLSAWRKHISYMPQFVYLNDDTIRRNIALGVPDEEIDENLLWECLKKANADKFVKEQPQSIDTVIGERGARLSGGQRQRLGIARALYNQPDILILDEATTALDPQTEKQICNTLKKIAKNITIIAISHQPELISITDRVYRMEEGQLSENEK